MGNLGTGRYPHVPPARGYRRGNRWVGIVGAAVALVGGGTVIAWELNKSSGVGVADAAPAAITLSPGSEFAFARLQRPARTVVSTAAGATLAIFTDGARTVRLTGPTRTFREPRFTKAVVTTNAWVRLAPREWKAGGEKATWFEPWLRSALADRRPDVLGIAMEYVHEAKRQKDRSGLQIAGDAHFGPVSAADPDGRAENSDFYDYLGKPWTFPTDGRKERPDPARRLSLDCSGFLRMVYGYRQGYPLRGTNTPGVGLPRRAYAMAEFGPGVRLVPNTGERARQYDLLQPGDLLFFNAGPVQNAHIEHSGMYLGVDNLGHHRFISSRAQANGPTMGDLAGASTLDGDGYWAVRYRTARRL